MQNTITLYQYLHCPYCIRVRMALGFLNIAYNSVLLPYADEATPVKLTGKKMAPIIQRADATFMNESLDIIKYLDPANKIKQSSSQDAFVNLWLEQISKPLFNLLMPYYLHGIEFSDVDKKYFQQKKEIKRGPFSELVKKRKQFGLEIDSYLSQILPKLNPYIDGDSFTLQDIILSAHLWGLYLAYDYRISDPLHRYLQLVAKTCNFNYDYDAWLK